MLEITQILVYPVLGLKENTLSIIDFFLFVKMKRVIDRGLSFREVTGLVRLSTRRRVDGEPTTKYSTVGDDRKGVDIRR